MGANEQPSLLLRRHRLTVSDYYRMAEIGVLAPDARTELIDGEILDMATIGTRHGSTVKRLNQMFSDRRDARYLVCIQDPLQLGDHSEPEPDIQLLRPRDDFYATAHPTAADVLLLIEVSDTTSRYEREIKIPLYARHGVPEVWIVDLDAQVIRFFRDPRNGEYRDATVTDAPGRVAPLALPDIAVDLAPLLG